MTNKEREEQERQAKARDREELNAVKELIGLKVCELHDAEFRQQYPRLALLLLPMFREGKLIRQEANLRVKAIGSLWGLSVDLPSEKLVGTYSVESLVALVDQLEEITSTNRWNWQQSWAEKKKSLTRLDDLIK